MVQAGRSSAASGKAARGVAPRAAAQRTAVLPPQRNGRLIRTSYAPRIVEQPRLSIGQAIGLHLVDDPLDLRSSVALVIDQQTGETLYQKNPQAVLPIASITKVMTSMVVLDAGLPLDEMIEVTDADRDTERHSSSRLPVGARLSRAEMMNLALMASENRAAHALGRSYPGGLGAFVAAMNAKAQSIGMTDSRFADPTGLSSGNVSNARDLATMVRTASGYPLIRQYSTATDLTVDTGYRQVTFRSTNRLIDNREWDIGLQKTGYISEAGKCLVMQARIEGRPTIIVLLDAGGTQGRFADAQRLRKWVEQQPRETRTVASDTRS
jgi:D-alanyl-D-alanine endopeptidase (penicillin-binding protein 7)